MVRMDRMPRHWLAGSGAILLPPLTSQHGKSLNCTGDKAAVEEERARNKALGLALGCWKAGMLVENDKGAVAAALALQAQQ